MRKILIPTDFSDNAMNAIRYALELFKYDVSEFYLLHAYKDEIYADLGLLSSDTLENITQTVKERSDRKLEATLAEILSIAPNPRHKFHKASANGLLVDEADALVDEHNIDIIVMGTRGETDDRKLAFGSHTLQVLKYVQCPVLAIPANYEYTPPRRILFPTNYLIPYKRRELKLLCEMGAPFRSEIDMLYVSGNQNLSHRQEDNKAFLKDELNKNKVDFKTIDNKNVAVAINQFLEENPMDMLVMVNTRHSFLENLLFKSTIDKISLKIDIPFLALQNIRRN